MMRRHQTQFMWLLWEPSVCGFAIPSCSQLNHFNINCHKEPSTPFFFTQHTFICSIYIYICYHVEVTIINFSALKNSSFHSAYSHPYQWLPLQYLCWCCLCSLLPLQATSTRTLTSHGVMAGPRYSTMDSSSPSPLTRPLALASSPGMNICLGRLTCSWSLCLVTLRALSLPTM